MDNSENLRHRTIFSNVSTENGSTKATKAESKKVDEISKPKWFWCREDLWLWMFGMTFMALLTGLVLVMGGARGWNAQSGFTHNVTVTSKLRFLPEPYEQEPGVRGRYGPDAASRWYYWKLKPGLVTVWTRLFPWAGYLCHQIVIWAVIYCTQNSMDKKLNSKDSDGDKLEKFSTNIRFFNVFAVGMNVVFHLLHLLNTHISYDALAQDVSIASSQSSVVVILILVILMEYDRRGLLFGWPVASKHNSAVSRFLTWSPAPSLLIRKYHGYAFAWAAVFTFWYHPMENTWGHLSGAFYTWIILLQGSLLYTRLHVNEYWRQLLEAWVIVHGYVVAAQTGGPEMMGTRLWPMFTFGFGMAWVVTQIFGLSIWSRLHTLAKLIPLTVFMMIVTWAYSWIPDRQGRTWVRMGEILRLPLTYYLYFVIAWISGKFLLKFQQFGFISWCMRILQKTRISVSFCRYLLLLGFIWVYVVHTLLAVAVEYKDVKMRLTPMSLIFDAIFIFGSTLSFIFLDEAKRLEGS